MNDADFMLDVLRADPGEWVPHHTILTRSFAERGCGLTVHSRAATLRERGYRIECKVELIKGGRRASFYRLLTASPLTQPGGADIRCTPPEGNGERRADGLQNATGPSSGSASGACHEDPDLSPQAPLF